MKEELAGKKLGATVVAAIIIVAGVGGGYWWFSMRGTEPSARAQWQKPGEKVVTYPFDKPYTTDFQLPPWM